MSATKEYFKIYFQENKPKLQAQHKSWYENNKGRVQELNALWKKNNPDKIVASKKRADFNYVHGKRKLKRKERREKEPKYRLDDNFSSAVSIALRGRKEGRKWESLVGYTIEDLANHLEKRFDAKMTWSNYGKYWHIDHIKPKSLFQYEIPEDIQFKECWALVNLQPMEKIANIKKGNKYEGRSMSN